MERDDVRSVFGVDIPDSLRQAHKEHKDQLVNWSYCKVDNNGQVEEVHCKLCKSRISGPRAWGDPQIRKAKDVANTVLITQMVRVMPFNSFTQLMFSMEDGSHHLTTACKRCADKVVAAQPLPVLQAMYAADIGSLAETALTERDMQVVETLALRQVASVRLIKD